MNLIACRNPLKWQGIGKTLLMMKFTAIFLLAACLNAAAIGNAQKVSIAEKNAPLEKVFKEIKRQTGYTFVYREALIKKAKKVTIQINNASIEQALNICLEDQPLSYSIVNEMVIIKERELALIKEQISIPPPPIQIQGKILNDKDEPLGGATISEKGTNNSTTTKEDGSFTLNVAGAKSILIISYVGYETKDLTVGKQTALTVQLIQQNRSMNEIVVVGYGTQKKVNLTGAVATVTGAEMTKRPVTNAATMLQGLLPGVNIVQTNGQPGQGNVSIQIWGKGTFSGAGSNPLILIDGVPGSLENLDPNTIESVSVLKDAASASIYGSRGANGVILVTSKSGKNNNGKLNLEYNFNYGIHSPTKMVDLVTNSADYMKAWNDRIRNSNYGVDIPSRQYPQAEIDKYKNATDRIQYPNFDWVDFIINPAPTVTHNVSISGGKQTHYNLSLGYVDQKGTMEVFSYKRYNAQLNIVSDISKKLKVGANIQLKNGITHGEATGQQNYFLCILAQPPTIMATLADGSGRYSWRAYPFEENNWNPYKKLKEEGVQTTDYYAATQIWSDLEIVKGLHWNFKAAGNFSNSQFTGFTGNSGYELGYRDPSMLGYQYTTYLSKSNSNDLYTNIYTYLNYDKKLGLHNLNLMAGYSNEEDNFNYLSGYRNQYASPSTPELNAGAASSQTNSGYSNSWALESGFGRLNYTFNNKYLFEANIRYDGTSRLPSNNRWGFFPSVSAGWKLSEESFMQATNSWLSNVKLRASWGKLGNQNIGLYPYQAMLSLTGVYPFDNSNLSQGAAQTALNNENITWETTTTSDIGLDLTLFKKLSLAFNVYKKFTSDILRGAQVTSVVGLAAPTVNSGAMQNTGFDLDMQYSDRINSGTFKGLKLGGGLTIDAYNNKLVTFGAKQDNGSTLYEEGRPWNTFYLLQADGIFQTKDEVAKSPKQFGENTQPGMLKYKDVNGDGKIDNTDRVPMEDGVFPAFSYGANFSADWKGFDLYGFLQGVAGSKVYVTGWGIQPFVQGSAPTKTQLAEAWTPENHSNTEVMLGDPKSLTHPSTYLLKDNSYLRLKTLQLGYTLPNELIGKLKMSRLRVYFAADNLFTATKYPGLDPERSGNGTFVSYPQNKIISFGLNVNL